MKRPPILKHVDSVKEMKKLSSGVFGVKNVRMLPKITRSLIEGRSAVQSPIKNPQPNLILSRVNNYDELFLLQFNYV